MRRHRTRHPDHAIEFDQVSRGFTIHHERKESLQDWFIHRFRRDPKAVEHFWALKDVTFAVQRGETIGLIGRNGAGKSTLLKLVTGILEPSKGQVRVAGRTYAMLELGAGFHPELSGRDNIYLNGSIYGFGRKKMRRKFEEIVAFAELERFIDTPIKYYSSGMFMRLGFSTAIHMDPEILVIDEVLSVGDAAFQRRCNDAIRALQARDVTIMLVTHNSEQVREFCHRGILLSGGAILADGAVEDVLTEYARLQMHERERRPEWPDSASPILAGTPGEAHVEAQIASLIARDASNAQTQYLQPGAPFTLTITTLGDPDSALVIILRWRTPLGLLLFESRHPVPQSAQEEQRSITCAFPSLPLHSDNLVVEALLHDPDHDTIVDHAELQLHLTTQHGPLLQVEHFWTESTIAQPPVTKSADPSPAPESTVPAIAAGKGRD